MRFVSGVILETISGHWKSQEDEGPGKRARKEPKPLTQ